MYKRYNIETAVEGVLISNLLISPVSLVSLISMHRELVESTLEFVTEGCMVRVVSATIVYNKDLFDLFKGVGGNAINRLYKMVYRIICDNKDANTRFRHT